ncbi:MAG: PilZ domain-containing protein [Spirochaetales bacterium]|nr:PilZ domain-containing protein [Spirochaetales bacterium]
MIVLDVNPGIANTLCYMLLSCGVRGIPASDAETALDVCRSHPEIDTGIIDVDDNEAKGVHFISEIGHIRTTGVFRTILHSASSGEYLKENIVCPGIIGYISKPFHEENTFIQLKSILSKIIFKGDEKRNYLRVIPASDELLRTDFRLKEYPGLLYGKIINLSMEGIAIALLKSVPPLPLKKGARIIDLHLNLDFREMTIQGNIVEKRRDVIIIRFISLTEIEKIIIARYIFRRISD